MPHSPFNEDHQALIRGEIETEEYVERLKAKVDKERFLRRENRRLRWAKGNYRLNHVAPHRAYRNLRWGVVRMLLQTRQFRLAISTAFLPVGYSISKYEPKPDHKHVGMSADAR